MANVIAPCGDLMTEEPLKPHSSKKKKGSLATAIKLPQLATWRFYSHVCTFIITPF